MAVALLFLSASHLAQAQELWEGAAVGMTVNEVKSIHPDAVAPKADPQTLAYGAVEGLSIDPHLYLEMPFRVYFYFKNSLLTQVTLNAKNEGTFDEVEPVFNKVAASLEAKMGPPVDDKRRLGIVSSARKEWISGETRIVLIAIGAGPSVFLNLNYQPLELPKKD